MSDEEVDDDPLYESDTDETNSDQEMEPPLEEYKEEIDDQPVISYPEINLKDSLVHLHAQEKKNKL